MSYKNTLRNLGTWGQFAESKKLKNISRILLHNESSFCILLTYTVGDNRISLLNLSLKALTDQEISQTEKSSYDTINQKSFNITLLNVFSFPFTILSITCTSKNVWVVGKEAIVDLKPYIKLPPEKSQSDDNSDIMDVDDIEEFQHEMFDTPINCSQFQKYQFNFTDMFIGCNFTDCALIRCSSIPDQCAWNLEFLLPRDKDIQSSNMMGHSFLNFPISRNKQFCGKAKEETSNPLIVFIHHSDPESHKFKNIFGINCSSPNVICLIGHPNGNLMWTFCNSNKQFHSSMELQTLFELKQSIIGIFFTKDIEGLEDCDCMLVIGNLGRLTLISSKEHPSFSLQPGSHPFWTLTVYLKSSIASCIVIKNYLLYSSSDGALWISSLSLLLRPKQESFEEDLASTFTDFCCIEQLCIADSNQGLVLLKTYSGSLYLTQIKNEVDSEAVTSSLPALMNDCLNQSNEMQELLSKKVLQSRLFATISTFASLKFRENFLKEPMTYSISEINLEPKKYLLVINLKCLESMRLDSELCYVTATVFTYFESNNTSVNKTVQYDPDQPTLYLELADTVLQSPFVSIFPLLVEVGLILQLPDEWEDIDCFKSVSGCLPFYTRVKMFMIHELNLLQSSAICPPQSLSCATSKTMKMIKKLTLERPISNVLQMEPKKEYQLPKKFNLCLSVTSVEDLMKNTSDSDLCQYIERLLFGNLQGNDTLKGPYLTCKKSPVSLTVTKNSNHIVISLVANSFESLIRLRIAVLDILLSTHNQNMHLINPSSYVNIPASIFKKCEELSKSLSSLFGKDVESDEVTCAIVQLYKELRTDVCAKLPIM